MSRSLAGQGPMFVMVMDTVESGRGLGRTGGQAAGREGTGGLETSWLEMCAAPCHRPPSFGSCLGLLFLSENLQRKFLGSSPWNQVAPMGPLPSRGNGRCC